MSEGTNAENPLGETSLAPARQRLEDSGAFMLVDQLRRLVPTYERHSGEAWPSSIEDAERIPSHGYMSPHAGIVFGRMKHHQSGFLGFRESKDWQSWFDFDITAPANSENLVVCLCQVSDKNVLAEDRDTPEFKTLFNEEIRGSEWRGHPERLSAAVFQAFRRASVQLPSDFGRK